MPAAAILSARFAAGRIILRTPYRPDLLAWIKSLPDARWAKAEKQWSCLATPCAAWQIVERGGEACDEAVRTLARAWGAALGRELSQRAARTRPGVTLWKHQDSGRRASAPRVASMLDMGMGTGKTLTAISLLAEWHAAKILILCPKSVLGVWRREIERWEPREKVAACILEDGGVKDRAKELAAAMQRQATFGGVLYVVANYDAAWREPLGAALLAADWDCALCDESHRIKSHTGVASKFAWHVGQRASRRLALTGTPLPHSPLDAFGQFRFLDAAIFGTSFVSFRGRYAKTHPMFASKVEQWLRQDELAQKMATVVFSCKSSEVLDLPEKLMIDLPVTLGATARRAYDSLEKEMVAEFDRGMVTAANALVKLLRLQQVSSGYVPLDREPDEWDDPQTVEHISDEKREALADFLEDVNEPAVVFCTFRHDLAAVREVAEKLGRTYGEISGEAKDGLTDQATMADVDIVGVQWQSGGVGIDLTRAAVCVFFSHTFNMGNYDQAIARLHRPGQTRPVRYYRLMAAGTIDTDIYAALDKRRDVVESVSAAMRLRIPQGELI